MIHPPLQNIPACILPEPNERLMKEFIVMRNAKQAFPLDRVEGHLFAQAVLGCI